MTRACPYCAERIQSAAIVCRFCGRDVQPTSDRPPRDLTLLRSILLLILLVAFGLMLLMAYRSQTPT